MEVHCTRTITLYFLILELLPLVVFFIPKFCVEYISVTTCTNDISNSAWNFIGSWTLMSGSILQKNHNHPLPYFRLTALCFYTWKMVYCTCKLQINVIHNLKQLQKISVISPRTECDGYNIYIIQFTYTFP